MNKLLFYGITMACFVFSARVAAQTGKVLHQIKTVGDQVTGVTSDGTNLWYADRTTDKIYCCNKSTGKIIRAIESPAYWPMGLAWDGKYLWNADLRGRTDKAEDRDGMIFKIDPKDGTILKTLTAPSKSPRGITWDGKYLWLVDDAIDKVIQFNPNDGTTIKSFPSPSGSPKGIAWDGEYLWISDDGTGEIYMVDPKTGYVIVIMDAPGKCVNGLAIDGNSVWAADYESNTISQLLIKDKTPFIRKDKKRNTVAYTRSVTCFGPGKIKSLDIHIAIPENRENQEIVGEIKYNIKPTKIVTDKWGQKSALFSFKEVKPGEKKDVIMTTTADFYNVRYFLYPEFMGTLDQIPQEVKDKYLVDDEKYQINSPIIRKTINEVVGKETNPYWIIRKLHQYLIGHLHYVMDGFWDTAPTVLRNGHASCSEYSFAYIALCRAAGIPARYVGSVWRKANVDTCLDDVYHRWVEIYLPGYGWIPTDPTHGDRALPRDQAFTIGFTRNVALITTQSGGGSEILEWDYNGSEFYTTDPKTNLNIIHFADWSK